MRITSILLALLSLTHPVLAADEIIVSASATLVNAFTAIGQTFEKTHPDVKVLLNFGAAGDLVQQMANGAPVDVFASANQKFMNDAEAKNLIVKETRHDFTGAELVLIVPANSVLPISDVAALTSAEVERIAIGKPASVSAGIYAEESLKAYGLWDQLQPKLIHANTVRQVLDYVQRGEVDVGFVFSSDAVIAGDKIKIALTPGKHAPIMYPIAVMTTGKQPEIAKAFVAFVLSDEGQTILQQFGFDQTSQVFRNPRGLTRRIIQICEVQENLTGPTALWKFRSTFRKYSTRKDGDLPSMRNLRPKKNSWWCLVRRDREKP